MSAAMTKEETRGLVTVPSPYLNEKGVPREGRLVTPEALSRYNRINTRLEPLSEILRKRREELALKQADVAIQAGLSPKSVMFVKLVETGYRSWDLNRLPLVAAALKLNPKDVVKHALFEQAPLAAMALFGEHIQNPEHGSGKMAGGRYTPQQEAVHRKLWQLPSKLRLTVLHMIDQMSDLATGKSMRGSSLAMSPHDE